MKVKLLLFLLVLSTFALTAQNRQIQGTVTSADDGYPVIGATIVVKGNPSIGTATDLDGNFKISVPQNTKTLVFSYLGLETKEVAVSPVMKVILSTDKENELDEVIVTGYQKIDRRLFSGSADKLSAETAKLDGVSDASRMLQGRVAGVSVQNVSGTFGAAPKMKVRGSSSIYGSQSPLWVVDGVILEDVVEISADQLSSGDPATLISSAVAGLNPEDIENFQILKDVSATALYGARAMNGVVVITTKKGKKGVTSINYTGEFTMRLKPIYYDYNFMNSQEQMDAYIEMDDKGWLTMADVLRKGTSGIYGHMYSAINTVKPDGSFVLENTPEARAGYLRKAEMRNTNWFDELFTTSIVQNHSVSMSSGSERNRSYVSLSGYFDPGWTESSKVQRLTGNFNSTSDITDKIALTFLVNGSIRKQRAPGTLQRKANVVDGEFTRDFDINPFSYALNTSRTTDPSIFYRRNFAPFNINHELRNNYLDVNQIDLKLQAELDWKPIKGLDLKGLISYRYAKNSTESKILDTSNMALAYRAADDATIADANQFLYNDPDNLISFPQVVLPEGGFYNREDFGMHNYYLRGTANYNNTFNEVHLTNFLLGAEAKSTDRSRSNFTGYGYQWSKGGTPYTDYRILKMMLQGNFDYFGLMDTYARNAAFFLTGSYSYMGKYVLNATVRYDGSNQLGAEANDKWLPTWNVSGAWNANEEEFLKTNKTISRLQVRATYGMNANPVPDLANALAIFRSQVTFRDRDINKEAQIFIEALQNKDLTWEKQHELNLGFDLGLWNNRVSLILDAYNRNIYDLIALVKTSGVGGKFYKYGNYAEKYTRGLEFSLSGLVIDTKDFKWNSNATFAYIKDKVTDIESSPDVMDLVSAQGAPMKNKPTRGLYSFKFAGLSDKGFPQVLDIYGKPTVGGINFQESGEFGHLVYNGPIDAPYQGGWNNTFSYKNWGLNIFITYQFGNVVRLDPMYSSQYSDMSIMPQEMKNRWVLPGDEKKTNIPKIASTSDVAREDNLTLAYNAYNYSTERVAKGDYIRLKEIYLTYGVPSKFLNTLNLKSAQLKLSISNLGLLYSDKKLNGQDPEFLQTGGVAMPIPRQFTFTVRVGL